MALTLMSTQVAERRKPSGFVKYAPFHRTARAVSPDGSRRFTGRLAPFHRTARAVPLPKVSAIGLTPPRSPKNTTSQIHLPPSFTDAGMFFQRDLLAKSLTECVDRPSSVRATTMRSGSRSGSIL